MISAPISVPSIVARPPVSSVPPTATAAMASSSTPRPTRLESAAEFLAMTMRPATPAAEAADHVDGALDAIDADAGEARRRLVAADGEDLLAEDGAPQRPCRERDDDRHDDHLDGNSETGGRGR